MEEASCREWLREVGVATPKICFAAQLHPDAALFVIMQLLLAYFNGNLRCGHAHM